MGREVSETALRLIAEEAAGGLRDALSLFEQVLAYAESDVTENDVLAVLGSVGRDVLYDFTAAILQRDLSAALLIVKDVSATGRDLQHFTQQAIAYYRDLMVVLSCREEAEALGIPPDWTDRLAGQGKAMGMAMVGRALSVLHDLLAEMRWSMRPRLLWELAVFRLLGLEGEMQDRPLPEQADGTGKADAPDPLCYLSGMWPQVLEQVKRESVRAHALLLEAQLCALAGQELEIGFKNDFHREMMEKPEFKQVLGTTVKKILGHEVTVCCRQLSGSDKVAPGKAVSPEEIVDTAAEIFSGKIIGQ
jgi:DNA polymerase-3 subunit gamma/tau